MVNPPGKSYEYYPKGYVFNSTNAHSKRSHYFIKYPVAGAKMLRVPDAVINGYNRNLINPFKAD